MHAWTVLTERTSIDADSNNISLQGIEQMEITVENEINEQNRAMLPIQLEIAILWYREFPERGEITNGRVKIIGPNGEDLGITNFEIDLTNHQRTRSRIRLNALPVIGGGRYFFITEIETDGGDFNEVGKVPLELIINIAARG